MFKAEESDVKNCRFKEYLITVCSVDWWSGEKLWVGRSLFSEGNESVFVVAMEKEER